MCFAFILFPFYGLILLVCSALAFYRLAEMENLPGSSWATLSVAAWIGGGVIGRLISGGLAAIGPLSALGAFADAMAFAGPLVGQLLLLVALCVVKIARGRR